MFEYLDESPFGLYGSIPLLLAHKQGLTVGAFWWGAWQRTGAVLMLASAVAGC